MTLKEHKIREDDNESLIFLYKEGVFWKAYEKSAYLLSLRGYDYQVNWRSSEDCLEGVVSVDTSLPPEAIAGTMRMMEREPARAVIESGMIVWNNLFFEWREKKIAEAMQRAIAGKGVSASKGKGGKKSVTATRSVAGAMADESSACPSKRCGSVARELLGFRLEESTPVDCFELVRRLQERARRCSRGPAGEEALSNG